MLSPILTVNSHATNSDIWFIDDEIELGETYSSELATLLPTKYFTSADEAYRTYNENLKKSESDNSVALSQPSVIITDLSMPGMNGLDFIKNLRDKNYQGEFILASGYAGRPHLAEAFNQNVSSFIDKPFDFDHLKKCLLKCIERSSYKLQSHINGLQKQIQCMTELIDVYHLRLSGVEDLLFANNKSPFTEPATKMKYLDLMTKERALLKELSTYQQQIITLSANNPSCNKSDKVS